VISVTLPWAPLDRERNPQGRALRARRFAFGPAEFFSLKLIGMLTIAILIFGLLRILHKRI
jgi:hypothetical protein